MNQSNHKCRWMNYITWLYFLTENQIILITRNLENAGFFSTRRISLVVSSLPNFLIKYRESRFCFGLFCRINAWLPNLKTFYPSPLSGQSNNKKKIKRNNFFLFSGENEK
ncbi:hypothetical protein HanRHA438_Chr11g0481861 [Helianthus annuus]|nr:hypothetical protein HanRHA438_Chr11g0481861 [Helianthus annuus]